MPGAALGLFPDAVFAFTQAVAESSSTTGASSTEVTGMFSWSVMDPRILRGAGCTTVLLQCEHTGDISHRIIRNLISP